MSATNRVTLKQLGDMDGKGAESIPTAQLAMLIDDVAKMGAAQKVLADKIWTECNRRFGNLAAAARSKQGEDTGTVNFDYDGEKVKAVLPKKVEYDQPAIAQAVQTLLGWGEDISEYVKVDVSETKFKSWPTKIRALFEPARCVGAGKQTYSIKEAA